MNGIPRRSRGVIALDAGACTSCMLCVRECPDRCIEIDSHQEQITEPGARRPRSVAVLDRFAIDWTLCMYCGICVEVCPFDALFWSPEYDYAATTREGLVQETDQLAGWMPPPDAPLSGI